MLKKKSTKAPFKRVDTLDPVGGGQVLVSKSVNRGRIVSYSVDPGGGYQKRKKALRNVEWPLTAKRKASAAESFTIDTIDLIHNQIAEKHSAIALQVKTQSSDKFFYLFNGVRPH